MVFNKRLVIILSLLASGASAGNIFANRLSKYTKRVTSAAPALTSSAAIKRFIPLVGGAVGQLDEAKAFFAALSVKDIISFMQREGSYLRGTKSKNDFVAKIQEKFVPSLIDSMFGYLTSHGFRGLYDTSKQNLLAVKNMLDAQINKLGSVHDYLSTRIEALNVAASLISMHVLSANDILGYLDIPASEYATFTSLIDALVALPAGELRDVESSFDALVVFARDNLLAIRGDLDKEIMLSSEVREKVHSDIDGIKSKLVTEASMFHDSFQAQLDRLFANNADLFMNMFNAMPETITHSGARHMQHIVSKSATGAVPYVSQVTATEVSQGVEEFAEGEADEDWFGQDTY